MPNLRELRLIESEGEKVNYFYRGCHLVKSELGITSKEANSGLDLTIESPMRMLRPEEEADEKVH